MVDSYSESFPFMPFYLYHVLLYNNARTLLGSTRYCTYALNK